MITITIYKYLLMSIETEEISMPGLKYSRQRESIINCLKGRKDHPTADMIYASWCLGRVSEDQSWDGLQKPFFISGSGRDSPLFMRGRTGSL